MISIRKAKPGDEIEIFALINELALYEKEPHEITNTATELGKHLFEEHLCDAIVAIENQKIILGKKYDFLIETVF